MFLTRHYIQYTGTAPTNSQLVTFNGAVASALSSDVKSLWEADAECFQIETIDLTSPTAATATTAETIQGTRSSPYVAAGSCMVTSYEIGRRYRGGHPRGYWPPGVGSDLTNPNNWSTTYTGLCVTGYNAYFAALIAAGWSGAGTLTHVNVSYYEGFTVITNPITGRARNVPTLRVTPVVDAITSLIVRSTVGSQRRRAAFVD